MYGLDSKKSSLSWQWPKAKVPWGTSKDGGLRWNDEGQKQQQPQPPRRKRYCRLNNIGTICRWQNQFCRGELQTSKMVIQILAVQVQPFGSDRWERHWFSIGICEKIKKWLSFPAVIDFLFIFLNSIWLQNRWWCYWSWRIRICTIRIWSQRTHGKTGIYNLYTGRPKHLHIKISSVTKISWFLYPYSHPYCVLSILWVFLDLPVPALAPSRL